jgi:hypothetical protein
MSASKKDMSTDIKEVGFVMRGIKLAQAWFTSVFIALQEHRILLTLKTLIYEGTNRLKPLVTEFIM